MRKLKLLVAAFMLVAVGAFALAPVAEVAALDPLGDICKDNPDSEVCQSSEDDANTLIDNLINTLLFLVGALAVVMIIVSGIWYMTANGDASKITRAKNTLTYSVVGLVIAFLAYAIITWVVDQL